MTSTVAHFTTVSVTKTRHGELLRRVALYSETTSFAWTDDMPLFAKQCFGLGDLIQKETNRYWPF